MTPFTPTPEQRARTGSREGWVRIAVGIEDADDIIVAPDQASAAS
jgi:O-acetylhomoserine/O-acetylserine sulfhydrylase-like pyridoxal-dependent enzyme